MTGFSHDGVLPPCLPRAPSSSYSDLPTHSDNVEGTESTDADANLLETIRYHFDEKFEVSVEDFLLEHCSHVPDVGKEFPLVINTLHQRYCQLVESMLEDLLTTYGATPSSFVETLKRCGVKEEGKHGHAFVRYVLATTSFDEFLVIMREAKLLGTGCFAS